MEIKFWFKFLQKQKYSKSSEPRNLSFVSESAALWNVLEINFVKPFNFLHVFSRNRPDI